MFGPLNPPLADWAGKRVWVIGASSGIGAALARKLLRAGARVALTARDAVRVAEVAGLSPLALPLPLDVSEPGALQVFLA